MIQLLLACADAPAPEDSGTTTTAPPAATVGSGVFTVTVGDTWEGDCDFADPATGEVATQSWTFDPRSDAVIVLYPDYWTVLSCALTDSSFACDDGSWSTPRSSLTRQVQGTFDSPTSVSGALTLDLDCSGNGCDSLKDSYGRQLDFPCHAEAAFEGTAE